MACRQVLQCSGKRTQPANHPRRDTPQIGALPVQHSDSGLKHGPGRPRKYQTVEAMELAINRYFLTAGKPTMSRLALALGLSSRQALHNYRRYSPEFSYVVDRAHLRMEAYYEEKLQDEDACVSDAILALKRLGWRG